MSPEIRRRGGTPTSQLSIYPSAYALKRTKKVFLYADLIYTPPSLKNDETERGREGACKG